MKVLVRKGLWAHAVDAGTQILISQWLHDELERVSLEDVPVEYAAIVTSGKVITLSSHLPVELKIEELPDGR